MSRILLNKYFPKEVQDDVKLDKPTMLHQTYIQEAFDKYVKPGDVVILEGKFNLDKNRGYLSSYYGTDGRSETIGGIRLPLQGAQPCLSFALDNNVLDFSGATFIVNRSFQDGLHIRSYKGKNTITSIGNWYTKRILDIDPTGLAAEDRMILQRNPAKRWLAPIDRTTGYAFKGTMDSGFNTTTFKHELSGYRSNTVNTSMISRTTDGVGTGYNGIYPQDNGTTSSNWGIWDGGFIGNWDAALLITQDSTLSRAIRDAASIAVLGGYIRGFVHYGIEVGSLTKPAGGVAIPRIEDGIEKYSAKNVTLKNITIEDIYAAGIQRTRFDNLLIDNCIVRRIGHPEWSLTHSKLTSPGVSQVDPGYGTASGRANQQGRLTIINSVFEDCNRKGIDAHHGTTTVITNNRIKAGVWGIQVAIEESQTSHTDPDYIHQVMTYTIRDNEIHAGIKGIDFANGGFGPLVEAKKGKWGFRMAVTVDNNKVYAPFGWFYNYAHDGFTIINNTFIFSRPYGPYYLGGNEENKSAGISHGCVNVEARGWPIIDLIANNRVMNSPYGNFKYGIYLEGVIVAVIANNSIDKTPYRVRTTESVGMPFTSVFTDVYRSGLETQQMYRDKHAINPISVNTYHYSRLRLDRIEEVNPPYGGESDPNVMAATLSGLKGTEPPKATQPTETTEVERTNAGQILWGDDVGDISRTSHTIDDGIGIPLPITQEGTVNAPAGFKGVISHFDPLVLSSRLKAAGTIAGVYARVDTTDGALTTEMMLSFKVTRTPGRGAGNIISVGNGTNGVSLLYVVESGGKWIFKSTYTSDITLDGNPLNTNTELKLGHEYTLRLSLYQVQSTNPEYKYIHFGANYNGNNGVSADFNNIYFT